MRTRWQGKSRRASPILSLEVLEERCLLFGGSLTNLLSDPTLLAPALEAPEPNASIGYPVLVAVLAAGRPSAPALPSPTEKDAQSVAALGLVADARDAIGPPTKPNADTEKGLDKLADKAEDAADLPAEEQQEILGVEEVLRFVENHRDDSLEEMFAVNPSTESLDKVTDFRLPEGSVYWMHSAEAASHLVPQAISVSPPHSEQLFANNPTLSHVESYLAESRPEQVLLEAHSAPTPTPPFRPLHVVAVAVEPTETSMSPPAPQPAQLANGWALPPRELEQAFQEFLVAMTELEQATTHWLVELGPTPWIFMGLALLGTVYGTLRLRPPQNDQPEEEHLNDPAALAPEGQGDRGS